MKKKPVGTGCLYCGMIHLELALRARVGKYSLPMGASVALKLKKIQKAAKIPYTLEVCPACGAIIDVLEKKT